MNVFVVTGTTPGNGRIVLHISSTKERAQEWINAPESSSLLSAFKSILIYEEEVDEDWPNLRGEERK